MEWDWECYWCQVSVRGKDAADNPAVAEGIPPHHDSLNVRSARTDKPYSVVLGRNVIPYPFAVFLIFLFSLTPGCPVNVRKSLTLRKNKNLPLTFCPFLGLGLFFSCIGRSLESFSFVSVSCSFYSSVTVICFWHHHSTVAALSEVPSDSGAQLCSPFPSPI